jgi:hypothetical protein
MAEGRPMPPAGGTVEHLVQCEELRETVGSAVREVVEAQQTPGASDGAAAAPVVLVPDQFEGVDACPAVTGPPLASLIIPAHNEETRLLPTLSKYADLLEERLARPSRSSWWSTAVATRPPPSP